MQMNHLLYAAQKHFEAEMARAEANLIQYLNNPVGIGEHSDQVADVIKLVEQLQHSKSCIELIVRHEEKREELRERSSNKGDSQSE